MMGTIKICQATLEVNINGGSVWKEVAIHPDIVAGAVGWCNPPPMDKYCVEVPIGFTINPNNHMIFD